MKRLFLDFLADQMSHPYYPFVSALIGFCVGLLIYIYHFQLPLFSKSQIVLCLVIALFVAILVDIFLTKITCPIYHSISQWKQVVILIATILASIVLSLTFVYAVPHIYPLYPEHTLTVNLNMEDLPADSDGLYFSHLQLAYRDVSFNELVISGDHEVNEDSIYFPPAQAAGFSWRGITGEEAVIFFQSTSEPHSVEITWDGHSQQVDLGSNADVSEFDQEFSVLPYEHRIVNLAAFPIIFLTIFILSTGIFSRHPYAYILLLVWLFVFVVFWPGIIGDVSILAVDELQQGHPTDWHPIVFTLLVAFCINNLSSASSVLIIQITGLALLVGNAFSFLNSKGVSNKVLIPLTCIFALLPTNFMSIITLTNDIPYSIVLMGLTYLAFRIVLSQGKWMESKFNLLLLTTAASLAILFRYNGIPAVGFFFLCLFIIYPRLWRKSLLSLSLVIAIWLFISGPFSSLLNVTHDSQGHLDNILLHHISAHVVNGTPMTDDESAYLDTLLPLEEWKYSCCSNTAMWANDDFDRDEFHANSTLNRQLEISLFQRNPGLEISHMLCASDIVWNVSGGCAIKHPFVEEIKGKYYWTRSYIPQYLEDSFLPGLIDPISAWLISLDENAFTSALLWHPAWYLYLGILCTVIFSRRIKSWRGVLLLAPSLGQSLFLLLFNRVQNFRYQYCIVLVGFLLLAIAFYKPKIEGE
ncbi:hypothetical protein Pelsub_P1863 [Pelolinea submarina]|nr:hypothetical protein Pelsub_P1863 [Pelolinea submarina]